MPATKKATAKKATAKKATIRKATAKGSVRSQAGAPTRRAVSSTGTRVSRSSTRAMPARPGDLIVIDSPQVGSQPREGEVLQVIQGEVSLSYRVKWADGHETVLSPSLGSARFVRA